MLPFNEPSFGYQPFSLEQNVVHIWHAELSASVDEIVVAEQCLSTAERERAERFVYDQDRQRFIMAHAILRNILALYLTIAPEVICFEYGLYGKPSIVNHAISFNMSHTGQMAVYALAIDVEVGIDIEWIDRMRRVEDMAQLVQRFFSAAELEQWSNLPAAERLLGFCRMWVLKEAYIKAEGQGLSFGLSRFVVDIAEADGRLAAVDGDVDRALAWRVQNITSPVGTVAALAVPRAITSILYFDWQSHMACSHHQRYRL